MNQSFTSEEYLLTKDIKQNRAKALLLTQMFQYFDITNYNYKQELLVQTEKAFICTTI